MDVMLPTNTSPAGIEKFLTVLRTQIGEYATTHPIEIPVNVSINAVDRRAITIGIRIILTVGPVVSRGVDRGPSQIAQGIGLIGVRTQSSSIWYAQIVAFVLN